MQFRKLARLSNTVIVHVCRADGVVIGKYEEATFRDKVQRGELPAASGQYSYWHEGMTDWKKLSEYRPPGKITKLLWNFPTREFIRQHLRIRSGKPEATPGSASEQMKELISSKGDAASKPSTDSKQTGSTTKPDRPSIFSGEIVPLSPRIKKR